MVGLEKRVAKLEDQRWAGKDQIIIAATDAGSRHMAIRSGADELFLGTIEDGEKYLASLPEEVCVIRFVGYPGWCL